MKFTNFLKRINVLNLVFISGLVFITYLLFISYYLRPSLDDHCLSYLDNRFGWWGTYTWHYNNFRGTCGYLVSLLILRTYDFFGSYLPFHLLLFAMHIGISFLLIRNILDQKDKILLPLTLAVFIFIFSVLPQADFAYIFWAPSIAAYFLNSTFFQLLVLAVFYIKKPWFSYLLIALAAYYSFSSIENFACSNLFILMSLIIVFRNSDPRNKLIFAFFSGVIFLMIVYFSPGTSAYQAKFVKPSVIETIVNWQKEFYSFSFWILPKTGLYYFMLIPVMLYVGFISGFNRFKKELVIKYLAAGTVFIFILIYLSILPNVYAMGKIGSPRTYTNLYYYIAVYLSVSSFLAGSLIKEDYRILKVLAGFSALILLVSSLDYIRINIPELKKYAISYDNRMKLIEENKTKGNKILYLPELYPIEAKPYPIYADIIASDSTEQIYWVNECMQNSLGLDFKIYEEK